MSGVIYADVLMVINMYITYFLLKSASVFSKIEPDRMRLLLSSVLGGVYSLTVFLPEKLQSFVTALRFFMLPVFVVVAFGFPSLKAFLRLCISFLSSSFIFAGLMFALWYFVCPAGMYFDGSVVYFDISILTLAVSTVVCYLFLRLFDRLFKSRAPVNTVFSCCVKALDKSVELKAFLDTGNRLRDYFTDSPVIIADKSVFDRAFGCDFSGEDNFRTVKGRMIFCNSLGGEALLPAFSPDEVIIRGADYFVSTTKATVALTEKKLLNGEYDAILPSGIFDNNFDGKDERESEKTAVIDKRA